MTGQPEQGNAGEVNGHARCPIGDSIVGGVSLDSGRQLSAIQPISGVSLDSGRQLSATQPISGVSLDSRRQLSATQPISDGRDEDVRLLAPMSKKPRTQVVKAGPKKDKSAADILMSIMKGLHK